MVGNTFSKYNDEFAYWCPDCEYKTSERVNLDIHVELNHETAPSPTNKELIDGNGKYTNYSNEWKISNFITVLNLSMLGMDNQKLVLRRETWYDNIL